MIFDRYRQTEPSRSAYTLTNAQEHQDFWAPSEPFDLPLLKNAQEHQYVWILLELFDFPLSVITRATKETNINHSKAQMN